MLLYNIYNMNTAKGVSVRSFHHALWAIAALGVWMATSLTAPAQAAPRHIVCVERVWCSIAADIGGKSVSTHALITTEGIDPHHLQPTPSMARQLAYADAVLLNGATYDDWALPLSSAAPMRLIAANYTAHWQNGDDPHLFFSPDTVNHVADAFAEWLISQEPDQKDAIMARRTRFHERYETIMRHLASLKTRFHGQPVAVTEPAGERLLHHAGLHVINHRWALSVMNENGVSPRDTAALEDSLAHQGVRFLLVNPTVTSPQISDIIALAKTHAIPTLSVGEALPQGLSWSDWIETILDSIDRTLSRTTP